MTSIISFPLLLLLLQLCATSHVPAVRASSPSFNINGSHNNNNDNDNNDDSNNIAPSTKRRRLGVTLGGLVFRDVNLNGSREPNEPGVPNLTLQVRTCSNGLLANVETASWGGFAVDLDEPGCYFVQIDATRHNFTSGSDVDPVLGWTANAELREGEATFWWMGLAPEEGSVASAPTADPAISSEPTTSAPAPEPSPIPASASPTATPTIGPTIGPTSSRPPSDCVARDVVEDSIMSSSPILRSSFGTIFSVSTPPVNKTSRGSSYGDSLFGGDDGSDGKNEIESRMEYIKITSLSLRVLTPLLNKASATNYRIWYRDGDYKSDPAGKAYDYRGNLVGWTLVAGANSLGGSRPPPEKDDQYGGEADNQSENSDYEEPLIMDPSFLSGAFPSDAESYAPRPSSLLDDGGMDTLNSNGARIKTYLYKIPSSIFKPISIPKYGGKASFYVALDRATLQYGPAEEYEWDTIDVENGKYNGADGEGVMNVRIHVGEGVTSYPWMDATSTWYQPKRFVGKVWYEQVTAIPCGMHVGAPSMSPSEFVVPPLPGTSGELGAVGEAVETTFVLAVYLRQDIGVARKMDDEVIEAFRPTMMDFLNEEWVMGHCVWGVALDVEFQKLSRLEGVGSLRRLRGWGREERNFFGAFSSVRRHLKIKIVVLQVEMLVKGVAHDDPRVCPGSSVPAAEGVDWEETMSNISIDFINMDDNANTLGERLKGAHAYFESNFLVTAASGLLERQAEPTVTMTEEEKSLLIPIIAAVCAAVLLLCLLAAYCWLRKRKREKNEAEKQNAKEPNEEEASMTPSNMIINMDKKDDKSTLGNKTKETRELSPGSDEAEETIEHVIHWSDPDDFIDGSWIKEPQSNDPLVIARPSLWKVPQLEEVVMMRGLPRRRSEPNMVTVTTHPPVPKRTQSLSCLREVWINLNTPASKNNPDLAGGYLDQLLNGTLYPVDDRDILYWERERYLTGQDPRTPYVPHGGSIEHNFIDEGEAIRVERDRIEQGGGGALVSVLSDDISSDDGKGGAEEKKKQLAAPVVTAPKMNPLMMQQVEMLEAKWKQLRQEYDEDGEYSSDEEVHIDEYNVNERIEQLMTHIEKLELERRIRLAQLKRQEEEVDELAKKGMVRAGTGINYNEELSRDFVIRKKKKKKKEVDLEDISVETSSEEEEEGGEFEVKWMRLKVPLAAQDAGAMRSLVNKGKDM